MNETCNTCKFWEVGRGTIWGECRRHAPVLHALLIRPLGEDEEDGIWPTTHHSAWCGEYRKLPEPEKK
jgi:hypothetical protein